VVLLFSLIILLHIFSIFRVSVFNELKSAVDYAHSFCLNQVPQTAASAAEIKALVCAENFSNLSEQQLYISSGLIHLFVVSGAHLLFIEQFLNKLNGEKKWPFPFIFPVLFFYGLMCSLNPPVSRCLVALAFNRFLYSKNIRWPSHFRILIVGCLTLICCPEWISSLSLQMSWVAAFTLAFIADHFQQRSAFFRQSLFFILLYPTIMWFQVITPGIILANLFLAPVLEFILLPAAFLTWFINIFSPIFDKLIYFFNQLLSMLEFDYNARADPAPSGLALYNWLLILLLHLAAHLFYVQRARAAK
jgi:competence protein ComEC